ncbi:MAG: TrmH family RNA methyltransferase [Aliihoeflea sp.]
MSETRMPRVGQVKEITSLANPIVKDIKALALKKFRDEQHAFMAEGLKLVIDALEGGWTIRTLIYSKAGRGNASVEKIASRTVALGGLVLEVSEKVLGAITRRDNPQMVVGVFEQKLAKLADIRLEAGDVWVALDRVRDPGNLGTIIRTVDAVGARGVILVGETTDPFSLETVRATMGSVFSVPIARATPEAFLAWKAKAGAMLVGTHLKGSVDYRTPNYKGRPLVILMGNEQQGLPDELARACDELVRIPQVGKADSLNLSVATGVMLYEVRRAALDIGDRLA